MRVFRGFAALSFIVGTALFVCLLVLFLAFCLSFCPSSKVRQGIRGFMDRMINVWVAGNRWMIRRLNVISIETIFDQQLEIERNQWQIVICNHQSWADVIVLQIALLDNVPPIKFFTKREFIWVPVLGFVLWILKFPYVLRASTGLKRTEASRNQLNAHSMHRARRQFHERPVSILIFCEGTRFNQEKYRAQQSSYRNLLRPKIGGLAFTIEALQSKTSHLLDVTLVYEGKTPNFWNFLCGKCRRVKVLTRKVLIKELLEPSIRSGIRELWQAKDREIDRLQSEFNS